MEALSNLPEDARGRLQTLLTLSQEVADQAAHGHLVVVDTGLGQATYTLLESGEESATTEDADAEQPARQPVLAWADQLDTLDDFVPCSPGLPLTDVSQAAAPTLTDAGAAVDQPTQDQPTQNLPVVSSQPPPPAQPVLQPSPGPSVTIGPVSKAKTKGGVPPKTPPVKAMPVQPQPSKHSGAAACRTAKC